ncbi:MAG: transcriptional regulator [Clostridiales bacterium]|jgi:hypothetical protein|nr:transcriptional regulator [Clostridiales bacterium]
MQFREKLDFLMNVTKTTNKTIADYASLDASHISRLRRGQRSIPKSEKSLRLMAEYFAVNCNDDYMRKPILDILNAGHIPADESGLSEMIYDWLINDKTAEMRTMEGFLNVFSNMGMMKETLSGSPLVYEKLTADCELSVFYGVEGKRQAVIRFLTDVVSQSEPGMLYLYSDEDMEWITDSRVFRKKWSYLMNEAVTCGNKIIVIHTVSRNLDEMLSTISQWMPLYMTGMVEPYYYPKKRDGIFKRTLFIAPDIAAVTSNSIDPMIRCAANLFIKNKEMINSYKEEFDQYFNQCRPLMRFFTPNYEFAFLSALIELGKKPFNTIIKSETLSLITMPDIVAEKILRRSGAGNPISHINYLRMSPSSLSESLQHHSITEIIRLPDIMAVLQGRVKVAFSGMLRSEAFYQPDEYVKHLENIVYLLKTYDNYHVHLVKPAKEDKLEIFAKEDTGIFMTKTSNPPIAVSISEINMVSAFWDYLKNIIGEKAYIAPNNKPVIQKLRDYIKSLQKHRVTDAYANERVH